MPTPTPTILLPTHTDDALIVPVALADALMQFASDDPTRSYMTGLGLDECYLSATDGHTAARVIGCDPGGVKTTPSVCDRSCWSGEYVETAIRVAKATRSPTIALAWSARLDAKFPPLEQVVPGARTIACSETIGQCAEYLARLVKVAHAVQGGRRASQGAGQPVALEHAAGPLDPVVWRVPGLEGSPDVQVVIMPVRL